MGLHLKKKKRYQGMLRGKEYFRQRREKVQSRKVLRNRLARGLAKMRSEI